MEFCEASLQFQFTGEILAQEKPAPIGRCWRRFRLEDQAEKGSGSKWRRVVRQVRMGETSPCLTEEEEP